MARLALGCALLCALVAGPCAAESRLHASGSPAAAAAARAPAPAGYTFIGDLLSWQPTASGIAARCAPGVGLRLTFLAPDLLRVTLARPEAREPLLEYPIARREWPALDVSVREEGERLVLDAGELRVALDRAPCRLTMIGRDGRVLAEDDPAMPIGWDGNEVRTWKRIEPADRFFGLGEKTGPLDKRGRQWVLWNSDNYAYTPDQDPLYQSIPFFIGLRGDAAFGVYLNNSARTTFNFGAGNHRYWSMAAERGPLDYFFFAGPGIPEIVDRYTELTGRPMMPPLWSLGYQQSRWSYFPDDEVLRLARTFREKRIPADVIYLDIHYMDGYRVFTWDPERFPRPEAMLDSLEELGFRVVTIVDPGVKADTTSGYDLAREGLEGGYFVRYPDGTPYIGSVWPGPSYFPDFSLPDARRWWGDHLVALREQGVDGIWNDMNEPAVWGKAFGLEALMGEGNEVFSQRRMHNLYGFLMAETAFEALRRGRPDERPFNLTRAGFAGEQRFTAVWTGDNVASWEHLQLGIRMLLGLGLSGVPFVGTDVGGFVGTPTPELYARWMQVGAFSPLFRSHTAANTPDQEPWSFGEQVEEIAREAIELRYRLLPYLYSLFHEAHTTGAPILRPLFWHYQDDPAAYAPENQHEFLVGSGLLVAPVVAEGATLRSLYLPEGRWLDLATGRVHDGGQRIVVEAPLDRIPMFLREGGILPLGPVAQHTGALARGPLTLEVFPAAPGAPNPEPAGFDLYEDDGISYDFEQGAYRVTRFRAIRDGAGAIHLARRVVHDEFAVEPREIVWRVHGVAEQPDAVLVDGAEARGAGAGWEFDPERRLVTLRLREAGAARAVVIR
ncbi:MAG TPA: TIM-barrel domain-containing protein [Woeseiaceae bacterium]|nr:TIM-barrel domain-containing protein [Woeseiaceae bacterium]